MEKQTNLAANPFPERMKALKQTPLKEGPAMTVHTVNFMRDINAETIVGLQNICLQAVREGVSELNIHISSGGGLNDYGFAAYNFIRSLPVPVTMHCIGNIESMAIVLFLAADTRKTVPDAKFKIHELLWGFPAGNIDHSRLAEYVKSLDFDRERYTSIFDKRTQGAQQVLNIDTHLRGDAKLLTSSEALKCGLATEIAPVNINPSAKLWWV
jgi:ATP-dependent protease ClpP protease subunit